MVCKNKFCWVCLGFWEPHSSSWYNCNRYDERRPRHLVMPRRSCAHPWPDSCRASTRFGSH
ncbi:probable E3 ubiquitin-protein ligase rbrA [Drosophila serrata]|uniref:probable E3 ubiquitin-protein ligase rbrA isoform X2 n=1 Tax=Drosophila serrata TaxID=7274 RepID=UPI000A1D2DFA|nr:probable E3 ubiquitin-protein ligase rbrA isoform X2 [Drosophila serrata]XP_020808665.1 probable E3 ubiquitin-protein ligase rbrA isoform X2 [Drosophila serrata]XP_020808666.1 probable E3 ubiquitin-protein ligase rbrA [Drosophila serrata]